MSIYRNTVAVMAAIMIASPLCCCALPAFTQEQAPEMSCCSHDTSTDHSCPGGQSCPECRAKDPRLVDAGKTTGLKVALLEHAPLSLFAVVPKPTGGISMPRLLAGLPNPGPPGWRLVQHQIFLL